MPDIKANGPSSTHADDATIAAYVDGRLAPAERQQVEAHLAACDDCYELVSEVVLTEDGFRREDESAQAAAVAELRPPSTAGGFAGRRRMLAAAGAFVAVAASILLLVFHDRSSLAPLVSIVGEERLTQARPTGGFKYGARRSPVRGSPSDQASLELLAEVSRLRERAARTGAPADVHAWGVGQLLTGDTAGAVSTLKSARNSAPEVAAFEADLGAAHLTLFLERAQTSDGTKALEALDRATSLDPRLSEAWFNKALALEALKRASDAISTWNRYLELDPGSPWSDEARRRRDTLQSTPTAR
jgi:tetratricopeptide (TPR) repeat protein